MHTYVRGYCERAAVATAEPGTPIRFVASTDGVARDQLTIAADGWQLANYRKSPVFLWAHDYMGTRLPIGRTEHVAVENGRLMADVVFDQGDDFAREVERKYRAGFLNAVSVGWDTLEFEPNKDEFGGKVLKAELLDISAVPVPGDPKALMERQKRALLDFGRDLLRQLDADPDPSPARPTWEQTAAAMADLFVALGPRPDDERQAAYRKVARDYDRHGKVPPEFRTIADLAALGPAELRGLFLAGEPDLVPEKFADQRAGAVLSARNRDDLSRAIELVQGVLARAVKESDQTDDERAAVASPISAFGTLFGVTKP